MLKNIVIKYKGEFLFTIGLILIFLSISLLTYDRIEYLKEIIFSDIELKKYNENVDDSIQEAVDENRVTIDTDYIEEDDNNSSSSENLTPPNEESNKKFIGFLEIEKISLKYGLVAKDSYYNNVNRNIQILQNSSMPDVENGNLILAAHSGSSKISYFKNLYKLSIKDMAKVYYGEYVYNYKIVNIYKVPKTGSLNIYRNMQKSCLTLITCTKNSLTEQTIYILELVSQDKNVVNNDD